MYGSQSGYAPTRGVQSQAASGWGASTPTAGLSRGGAAPPPPTGQAVPSWAQQAPSPSWAPPVQGQPGLASSQSWAPPVQAKTVQAQPSGFAQGPLASTGAVAQASAHRQQQTPLSAHRQNTPTAATAQAPSQASVAVAQAPSASAQGAQAVSGQGLVPRRSMIPTPNRSAGPSRSQTLYFTDQQTLPHQEKPAKLGNTPADAAGGNQSLEFALQVILNMQTLDPEFLSRAMLSPKDVIGTLDAMTLMQRLNECGPKLVSSEERLGKNVKALTNKETVKLLRDLGLDDEGIHDTFSGHFKLDTIHDDIIQVLKQGLPADNLADAVSTTAEHRLTKFLQHRGVTRYSKDIVSLRHDNEAWASVWQRLWLEYPSRPVPRALGQEYQHRSEMRVIIIGPGFGLLATPHMIDLVRGAGYQLLELPELPNLETMQDPAQIQAAVQSLYQQIVRFQPTVICAASKGGLYLNHLWQDPNWSIPCVLINAHPNISKLPQNAAVVVTQGSRDETFKRITERSTILLENEQMRDAVAKSTSFTQLRVAGDSPALVVQKALQVPIIGPNGAVQMSIVPAGAVLKPDVTMFGNNMRDPAQMGFCHMSSMDDLCNLKVPASISYRWGREDLEDLARTGAPMKSLLYLSCSGFSVRPGKPPGMTRGGDGHAAPESLCKDDCLPRLIDAAASGRPEDSLHESWVLRTSEERRAAESYLGYDPEAFKRLWTGDNLGQLGSRFPVAPDSDEFFAVEQVFRSNPEDKNYNFGHDWQGKKIRRIDRVQAGGQLGAIDAYYTGVKETLETQGTRFVNGAHTRWLFHGSRAIDSIIADPLNGFKTTLSKTTMWGVGSYFARDAQYPDDHGFGGEPRADGSKDLLLCLVVTGMSQLGDEAYAIKSYRHGTQFRYNSFVDSLSNPEIFVANTSDAILPGYVITYADA